MDFISQHQEFALRNKQMLRGSVRQLKKGQGKRHSYKLKCSRAVWGINQHPCAATQCVTLSNAQITDPERRVRLDLRGGFQARERSGYAVLRQMLAVQGSTLLAQAKTRP